MSQTLLERLAEGPVIGDGGFVFALEKRGYVKAGPWTPEAAIEHPDAGNMLLDFFMINCYDSNFNTSNVFVIFFSFDEQNV